MPAKRKKERIAATYFIWLLGQRGGVYYADGRSDPTCADRHSLGTRDRAEALEALKRLDLVQAVKLGRADPSLLAAAPAGQLSLAEGRRLYMAHVLRPRVIGGAQPVSAKRYRAVFDKFEAFTLSQGLTAWNQVSRQTLESYATHLEGKGVAYATQYLELTVLKQVIKWLVQEQRLPASSLITMPLTKPQGTTTYCWRPAEVRAMLRHCRAHAELRWLGDVITALACTGLRISELASLRWSDIDRDNGMVTLTDESTHSQRRTGPGARRTKSGRSRSFPIHPDLRCVLNDLLEAKDGLVFHGPRGGRLKPDTVRQIFVRDVLPAIKAASITAHGPVGCADGRLHSFRHYFCSICANRAVPEQMVMAWLGHRDSAMVRHYYHLHDDEARRQMARIDFLGQADGSVAAGDES